MKYFLLIFFIGCWHTAWNQTAENAPENFFTIEQINISGNKKTKNKIILRELNIFEKQTIRKDSIESYRRKDSLRLATVGLFTDIHIEADTLDQNRINWNIKVKERWFIIPEPTFQLADRNFNVWWTEQNRDIRRTIIGVTINHRNFRGNLENLIATIQVGYTKRFGLEYLKPYIDKEQKHGFGVGFSFAESQETFFATDSNKLKFVRSDGRYILRQFEVYGAYTYRPAYASRYIFKVGYKNYSVADTIVMLNHDYYKNSGRDLKLIEATFRWEMNKTDNWNYPVKGTKMIAQIISRFGLEGLDHQNLATLEVGKFYNPFGKWYISTIFRGRLSFPDVQPYALRYALGSKYDYVRGYEYYVIDGSHFGVLRLNLKREIVNRTFKKLPFKYLPVIPLRVFPKIFADVGYVENKRPGNSFLNNQILYSVGLGVDIFTAYDIKIRLEYAWNHLGQKDLFLHFNSE